MSNRKLEILEERLLYELEQQTKEPTDERKQLIETLEGEVNNLKVQIKSVNPSEEVKQYNAEVVLQKVEELLKLLQELKVEEITLELVKETLPNFPSGLVIDKHNLEEVQKFLKVAIELGFKGYTHFNCGLYTYMKELEYGSEPKGPYIYHTLNERVSYWKLVSDEKDLIISDSDMEELTKGNFIKENFWSGKEGN